MTKSTQVTQAQQIIDQLPNQAKRDVLFSLVGSLNASIVGTASSVVSRIDRGDVPLHELEVRDIELLMAEGDDRSDILNNVRTATRTAQNLRDQLLALSNDDTAGALDGTLAFMTVPPKQARAINEKLFEALMADAGMEGITIKDFQTADMLQSAQRAERLAGQRGSIEWIIEHVFNSNSHMTVGEDGKPLEIDDRESNTVECLPSEARERIYDKMRKTLERARTNTVRGVLFNDNRYEYGDIAILRAAIDDAKLLDANVVHDNDWVESNGGVAPNAETQYGKKTRDNGKKALS